jgi:hypothetical protein
MCRLILYLTLKKIESVLNPKLIMMVLSFSALHPGKFSGYFCMFQFQDG